MRVACPLCDGHESARHVEKDGHAIVRCVACGLVFAAERPSAAELRALYADPSYFAGERYYLDYLAFERNHRRLARRLLRELARHAPARGRLLDVGAAAGFFLDEARRDGWQVAGVEPSPGMSRHARESLGLDVTEGTLADVTLPVASFDAVCFIDSIEHLSEPRATLAQALELLAPGGIVSVLTPNVESTLARVMGRAWPHYTPPEHLLYFSRSTLCRLLGSAGMRVESVSTLGHYFSLAELGNKLVSKGFARGPRGPSIYLDVGDLFVIARK